MSSAPSWHWYLVTTLLLIAPTAIILSLQSPPNILRFNGITTHDGMRYFEVSLDPSARTPYCYQVNRYSRTLFPSTVSAGRREAGGSCSYW